MKLIENNNESKDTSLAIICADIFEYSKKTRDDHVGTHRVLKDRLEIVQAIVHKNQGRVIRLQGDGLLISFKKVRNAIYCATEIQTASHEHNFKLPLINRMLFRIGISFGSVICEGDEPFGQAVNTAKRLEELADPGGIYISSEAYDVLETSLPFPITYRGKIRVKNVDQAIHVSEIIQYEPLSTRKEQKKFFKHPIDRSYLGTLSIFILAISVIVLALSVVVLLYAVTTI